MLYYPPFRAVDAADMLATASSALKAYVDDLRDFDDTTLARAWRDLRRSHTRETWPTIGTIREACGRAVPMAKGHKSNQLPERFPFAAQANDALETPQGQWCLRNGCGLAYWERIAEGRTVTDRHGNRVQLDPPAVRALPDRDEVRAIYDAVQRNHERVATGIGGPGVASFAAIWDARIKRENQLAEQWLREAA